MVQALALAETGDLLAQAQPEQGVTYAEKIRKDEAQLDWAQSAAALVRKSRALDPFPGCVTSRQTAAGAETLKIWRLEALPAAQPATIGQVQAVDASGITIACGTQGQGRVLATQLQKAGGKRLPAAQFLAGFALQIGDILY
jgi:methionyl-tRNA formyltransferase